MTRSDCRDEYRIVLHYKHLPLDDDSRPLAAVTTAGTASPSATA